MGVISSFSLLNKHRLADGGCASWQVLPVPLLLSGANNEVTENILGLLLLVE